VNVFVSLKREKVRSCALPSQYTLTSQQLPCLLQRQNGSLLTTHWNSCLPLISCYFTTKSSKTGWLIKIILINAVYARILSLLWWWQFSECTRTAQNDDTDM